MTENVYTRCPGCATIFRVSAEQIALREGQVRCGQCRAVFDANNHRLALDPPREAEAATQPEERSEADLSSGLEDAGRAVDEAEASRPDATETQDAKPQVAQAEVSESQLAEPLAAAPDDSVAHEETTTLEEAPLRGERFEWKPRRSLRERPRALYGALIALLVGGIGAQVLLEYRDGLAARAPFTRPLLAAACAVAGCAVGPLHDAGALSIDASDLRSDPAHRGLLKLTATIRNRASYPIAWPHLELTLTDASDSVVARRTLAPGEYAGAAADPARGIPGNGEDLVTLFIDASQTSQAGYRLYLFYP